MENTDMKGNWVGIFKERGNSTQVEFTEYAEPKKFYMKPFVKAYLKKQRKRFLEDLTKALSQNQRF